MNDINNDDAIELGAGQGDGPLRNGNEEACFGESAEGGQEFGEEQLVECDDTGWVTRRSRRQSPRERSSEVLKNFIFGFGASFFYVASAMCILYGIVQIVGPALQTSGSMWDNLSCLLTLHVYEVALLCVALLIVLWKNVNDDAVTLVILIALFVVVSGIAMESMGHDGENGPVALLWIALGASMLAGGKIHALRKYLGLRFDPYLLGFTCVGLLWNFFTPCVFVWMRHRYDVRWEDMRGPWLGGWAVLLLCVAVLLVRLWKTKDGDEAEEERPFLKSRGMAWVFVSILIFAFSVHQYAVAHVFDIVKSAGDFVPVVMLTALVWAELRRAYGSRFGNFDHFILGVPVVYSAITIFGRAFSTDISSGMEYLFYPPALVLAYSIYCAAAGIFRRRYWMLVAAGVSLLLASLTMGVGAGSHELNYRLFGITVLLFCIIGGVITRRAEFAFSAVALVSLCVPHAHGIRNWLEMHRIAPVGMTLLLAGLQLQLITIFAREMFPRWMVRAATCMLAIGALAVFFPAKSGLYMPTGGSLAVLAVALVLWLRVRDRVALAVSLIPLAVVLYRAFMASTGWLYVFLSFVLLGVGAVMSLRKKGGPTG
ncbi:MAG: hypothetical protein JXR97_02800 [Planctomycetes bacterium]|nr:hypothetical protein [Planctomycetota bacterium]